MFLYYCDDRANVRETPGNILIRNCSFKNLDSIMGLPFGHIWCRNRSLTDICFENCIIEGESEPINIKASDNEPLSLCMKNCTVSPREGFENTTFIVGENIKEVQLINAALQGFSDPKILCYSETNVNIV